MIPAFRWFTVESKRCAFFLMVHISLIGLRTVFYLQRKCFYDLRKRKKKKKKESLSFCRRSKAKDFVVVKAARVKPLVSLYRLGRKSHSFSLQSLFYFEELFFGSHADLSGRSAFDLLASIRFPFISLAWSASSGAIHLHLLRVSSLSVSLLHIFPIRKCRDGLSFSPRMYGPCTSNYYTRCSSTYFKCSREWGFLGCFQRPPKSPPPEPPFPRNMIEVAGFSSKSLRLFESHLAIWNERHSWNLLSMLLITWSKLTPLYLDNT